MTIKLLTKPVANLRPICDTTLPNGKLTYRLLPALIQYFIKLETCVNKELTGDCWSWTGSTYQGYGRFTWSGHSTRQAHRITYEILRGNIPEGLTLDHLCRNRGCVNPDHLEPVTLAVNVSRGFGQGVLNAVKTECPKGHPYTPENTYNLTRYTGKTFRLCKICQKATVARCKARKAMRSFVTVETQSESLLPASSQPSLAFPGGAQ